MGASGQSCRCYCKPRAGAMTLCEHVHGRLQHGADKTVSGERSSLVTMYLHMHAAVRIRSQPPLEHKYMQSGCPGIRGPRLSVVAGSNGRLLHQSCSSPPKPCQMDQLSADRLPARLRLAIDNATFSTRHRGMPTIQSSQSNTMHLLM